MIIAEPCKRRRLPTTARRLLGRAAGDLRPPWHTARGRRGDNGVWPAGRVVCGEPVRDCPRPDHDRQGADVGVRADGRCVGVRRVAAPLYDSGRTLLHGITFGGHPLSAAIALKNLELFEREQVLDNVQEHEPYLANLLDSLGGSDRRRRARERLLLGGRARARRACKPFRCRGERGAIAKVPAGRTDPGGADRPGRDRGDTVIQIAPPLICDRPILDDLVGRLGDVLVTLSNHMGIPTADRNAECRTDPGDEP